MLVLHLPSGSTPAATAWDFLLAWQFEPPVLAALLLIGTLYLRGYRRLRRLSRDSAHDRRDGSFFLAGLVSLALALLSPIHSFSEELFAVHMLQHLLLISVAVPLLLLANPLPMMLWSLPATTRAAVGRTLSGTGGLLRALRVLTRPLVGWWLFVSALWLWHQPWAYQAALGQEGWHYLQHVIFFTTAVLFWWPVIGPAPLRSRLSYPARMLYVFATWIPNSVLGAGIAFAPNLLIPFYAGRPRHWGIDPLTDQQLAGLIMWIPGDLIYAGAVLALLLATLRREDRQEARATLP